MASRNTRKSQKKNPSKQAAETSSSALHDEEELPHVQQGGAEAFLLPSNLHPWLQFDPRWAHFNDYSKNLFYLLKKEFEIARFVDWTPLEAINLAGPIRELLVQRYEFMGHTYHFEDWVRLFDIQVPVFRELCFEFHSTIVMQPKTTSATDRNFMRFRLGGVARVFSMKDMAICLGIYTSSELAYVFFDDYLITGARVHETNTFIEGEFWEELCSTKEFEASGVSHRDMTDVRYRVIHRFLAHTIANRRENTEKITLADIWYLKQIWSQRHVNIPYCVAVYLKTLAGGLKDKSPICGGHFITLIAKFFDIDFRVQPALTRVELVQKSIGYPMYHATHAIAKAGKNFVPYPEQDEQPQPQQPKRRRGRGQLREEEVQQEADEPSLLSIMQGIQGLQVGQNEFRDDFTEWRHEVTDWQHQMDYRVGNIEYESAWSHHNIHWIAEQQGYHTTRAEPLYQWGTPESHTHPPPIYHPDTALEEAQRLHQEEYERGLQQEWRAHEAPSEWTPWPSEEEMRRQQEEQSRNSGWGWPR